MVTLTYINLIEGIVIILSLLMMGLSYYRKLWSLGSFMLILGVHMGLNIFLTQNTNAYFELIQSRFVFLYGPLLYFFIQEITLEKLTYKGLDIAHFSPFILMIFLDSNVIAFALISIGTYCLLIFRYIQKYNKVISHQLGDEHAARLIWLKKLIIFLGVFVGYDISRSIAEYFGYMIHPAYFMITLLSLIVLVLSLGLFSLQFKARFIGLYTTDLVNNQCPSQNITIDISHVLKSISEDRLFLRHDFRLNDLAEHLVMDARELSKQLYAQTSKRFPKHIQTFRIDEAKNLIKQAHEQGSRVNFLQIAYDAGFQAKSSFNLAFKEETRLTPTQYKLSLLSK